MNIEQAKTIPITTILDKLNFKAENTSGDEKNYVSPMLKKGRASLSVNTKTNIWYDHGLKRGGDIVDFAVTYLESQGEDHTVSDALRFLKSMSGYVQIIQPVFNGEYIQEDKTLALVNVTSIKHLGLIKYAEGRGIPEQVTRKLFREALTYNKQSKNSFFSLCIKNEEGGYELRNPKFKGSIGKIGITFIRGLIDKPPGVNVFKSAFDYASILTQRNGEPLKDDAIIMHSYSHACLKLGAAYIQNYGYRTGYTWMDNDEYGKKATKSWQDFFATEQNLVHVPMNDEYSDHKDVNEAHMSKLGLAL